jgi:hypothetical protein
MRRAWQMLAVALMVALSAVEARAGPFVLFPKAGQLVSPDGRFVVRDVDREAPATEFVGTFRSLWVTEVATGRSKKICDYMGVAAVAWSGGHFLIVTQYVGRRSSRALLFSPEWDDILMIDTGALIRAVPLEMRQPLRNDHVFIEGTRIEADVFYFHVWGYGALDPGGFRWKCQYGLQTGEVACEAE